MKLLLISNSTNAGEPYLQYPLPEIARFLKGVREVVFVPYAAVTSPMPSTSGALRRASPSWASGCVRSTVRPMPRT